MQILTMPADATKLQRTSMQIVNLMSWNRVGKHRSTWSSTSRVSKCSKKLFQLFQFMIWNLIKLQERCSHCEWKWYILTRP